MRSLPLAAPAAALLLALAAAAPLAAQREERLPPRPRLAAAADTNDAQAYFQRGMVLLDEDNANAAGDAFFWAHRLNPGWADALYAQWVARLTSNPRRLVQYMNGTPSVVYSSEIARIDSLKARALALDPFYHPRLDRHLFTKYVMGAVGRDVERYTMGGQANRSELEHYVRVYLQSASPSLKGWMAFSDGNFAEAVPQYQRAIDGARFDAGLRMEKAQVLYLMGSFDGALEEMTRAATELRARDERDLVYLYQSKSLVEQSIGMIHEAAGRPDAAREAYARALQEDLSYFPAHLRTAALALAAGDTASAAASMDLAVQVQPAEPALRLAYAQVLLQSRRPMEAVQQLQQAVALNADYAEPYQWMARVYDAAGLADEALLNYDAFLARAARGHAMRASAQTRAEALRAEAGAGAEAGSAAAEPASTEPAAAEPTG